MRVGTVLAVLGLALMVGGMGFFGAVVAPLVFLKLPIAVGGPFIRQVFPWYFGFVAGSAAIGGVGFLLRGQKVSGAVLGAVVVEAVWAWLWLMPHMDGWRAAGDVAAFDRGHAVSTWLNGVEILAGVWLLVRVALG